MYRIGIDLGGTNIVAGVVDDEFRIVATAKCKTRIPRPAEEIVVDMARMAKEAVQNAGLTMADIAYVGVGSPGTCNADTGIVEYSNNLQFEKLPLRDMLGGMLDKAVYIENDANAAALGEALAGAAKGAQSGVCITLGTGVGGGIIVDGQIVSGLGGAGGEVGHSLLVLDGQPCTCGRSGCWEAYASATALIRQGKEAAASHPDSLLNRYPALTGRDVFDAADDGDAAAKAVLDRYYDYVAAGITNLVNILSPEMVLIGGGISRQGERLLAPIRRYVAANCFGGTERPQPVIQTAQLGNEAGIIGAAAL